MKTFQPPPFRPDRWMRGGHLQTLASLRRPQSDIVADRRHLVKLADGDAIVLHENRTVDSRQDAHMDPAPDSSGASRISDPSNSPTERRSIVMFHGLGGCHGSPYMIRLAIRFVALGWAVYRVDMRGCGAARDLARGLNHAGRSEDVHAAIDFVARYDPDTAIAAVGVSLGGNQLLRFAGRIGAGMDPTPDWFGRLRSIASVAPPIDLVRCSENMQRWSRRVYNYYFIRSLFEGIPTQIRQLHQFQEIAASGRPKTLLELDERLTAPLSGFAGAMDYYRHAAAASVAALNPVDSLVVAAKDDPIVPADCFANQVWPATTRLILTTTGGHAGFVSPRRRSWMDDCLVSWLNRL